MKETVEYIVSSLEYCTGRGPVLVALDGETVDNARAGIRQEFMLQFAAIGESIPCHLP